MDTSGSLGAFIYAPLPFLAFLALMYVVEKARRWYTGE